MRSGKKIALSLALAAVLGLSAVPSVPAARADYTPPYETVKIGLFSFKSDGNIDKRTFTSANLMYDDEWGSGYEVGYYDGNRQFVPIGAGIDTREITVIMDRNMVFDSDSKSYKEATAPFGGVVVGCAHLRMDGDFDTYDEAAAQASQYEGGFVRYRSGRFLVLRGQYTSREDAMSEAQDGWSVDTGSSYTVTVVETRTNRILFEYDDGSTTSLAIRAYTDDGSKARTWHRDYCYYGGFAFQRNTGGLITVVNYVDVEDYVKGVVPWEMNASWPREALKAQAVTARTYLMANISKHRSEGFDICNTVHCQAYHGTERATENSDAAVDESVGQYLTYNGKLCQTFYASSNGGASENSENVWNEALPYCRGVVDPYEANIADSVAQYHWTREFTPSSLGEQLRNKGFNCADISSVDMTFTDMGNVYSITFTDVNGKKNTVSKAEVRTIIGGRSLRYTLNGTGPAAARDICVNGANVLDGGLNGAFVIGSGGIEELAGGEVYAISGKGTVAAIGAGGVVKEAKNIKPNFQGKFIFSGTGYGHNVGMSQWGAFSMAKFYDKTCEDILTFYYTGTQITSTTQER